MKIWFLFFAALFLCACSSSSTSDPAKVAEKQITDYVTRPGIHLPFSTDTMAMLARTIGKPMAFSANSIQFATDESLFEMPIDSALKLIEKPSFFRNPEEKLSAYLKGEAPQSFPFDLYDPYPDTWVDSVSLADYKLKYEYEDMSSVHKKDKMYSHLNEGSAKLLIQNQSRKEVVVFELKAELKKRFKSGAYCVVEPFSRTFKVEKNIPPLTQVRTTIHSDSLAMDMVCKNNAKYFEVPYKAQFTLTRYQFKGDPSWIDARRRNIISD